MKFVFVLTLMIIASEGSCQPTKVADRVAATRIELKNYALCKCIQHSSTEGNALITSDGSSAGYFEIGSYSIETYSEIDSLAKVAAMERTVSKYDRPLALMKCIDFYNSKKLDDFVWKFDSEITTKK